MERRIEFIDILKGLGIVLMVLGHLHLSNTLNRFIYAFHMPLFFIISGYLYRRPACLKNYSLKKVKVLMSPYLLWGCVYSVIAAILTPHFFISFWKSIVAVFFKGTYDLPVESALWFLPAMLWTSLFYALIDKTIYSNNKKVFVLILLTLLGCSLTNYIPFRLPLALDSALSAIGFYFIGHCVKEHKKVLELPERDLTAFMLVTVFIIIDGVLILKNNTLNIRAGIWGYIPLSYFNATIYTWIFYRIAVLIDRKLNFVKRTFLFIGYNSIIYLCINHLVLKMVMKVIKGKFFPLENYSYAIESLLIFICSILIMCLFVPVFTKTRFRFMFGK